MHTPRHLLPLPLVRADPFCSWLRTRSTSGEQRAACCHVTWCVRVCVLGPGADADGGGVAAGHRHVTHAPPLPDRIPLRPCPRTPRLRLLPPPTTTHTASQAAVPLHEHTASVYHCERERRTVGGLVALDGGEEGAAVPAAHRQQLAPHRRHRHRRPAPDIPQSRPPISDTSPLSPPAMSLARPLLCPRAQFVNEAEQEGGRWWAEGVMGVVAERVGC
eukprot:1436074-Rhodomonas_salina.1